jgi:hypothetical protein
MKYSKKMNFHKKVTKSNYIREYIVVLNGLLDLTPREIDVLATLIKIDLSWVMRSSSEIKNIISTDNRRLVMKDTNMNKSNFTKAINKFKSMRLLVASPEGGVVINELLKPAIDPKNKVEITFILDLNDAPVIQQTI